MRLASAIALFQKSQAAERHTRASRRKHGISRGRRTNANQKLQSRLSEENQFLHKELAAAPEMQAQSASACEPEFVGLQEEVGKIRRKQAKLETARRISDASRNGHDV
jgi:hypothetical protein